GAKGRWGMNGKRMLGMVGASVMALALGGACSTVSRATTSDKKTVAFQVAPNQGAAEGELKVWSEGDQQHVRVEVKRLPQAESAAKNAEVYVVWLEPQGSSHPYNVGTLSLDKDRDGKFETTTPFRDFKV